MVAWCDTLTMGKNFDRWSKEKKTIDADAERPFYHGREIWWCAVGINVGNEIDGTGEHHDRPVLVLRPFNADTFLGLALYGIADTGRSLC